MEQQPVSIDRIFPDNQKWGEGKKLYWFWSPEEKMALWRYDNDEPIDVERKEAGNYFFEEKQALQFGGVTKKRSRWA